MNFEISKLFYNIVPGGMYLAYWTYIYVATKEVNLQNVEPDIGYITLFVIFAYFLGFLLQTLFRMIRSLIDLDSIVIAIMQKQENYKLEKKDFYNKNAKLWKDNKHSLSNYFATYAAFWSNIAIGSTVSIFVILFNPKFCELSLDWQLAVQFLLLAISTLSYYLYKKSQINSVYNQVAPKK